MPVFEYEENVSKQLVARFYAWVDDIDVTGTVTFGVYDLNGDPILNGQQSITIENIASLRYPKQEFRIDGISLVDGQEYQALLFMTVARSGTPVDSKKFGHVETDSLELEQFTQISKDFTFTSPETGTGITYHGSFYLFYDGNDDFSTPVNFGDTNVAYGGRFFFVLGEATVDELTLRISGASYDPTTNVTNLTDTEDVVIPDATAVDSYFESTKFWLNTVTITVQSGTAKNCNYGYVKYFNNEGEDFTLLKLATEWKGGATDTDADVLLYHHKPTGWTYNAGAEPTPPDPIASMADSYGIDSKVIVDHPGSWDRSDSALKTEILCHECGEGIIVATKANNKKTFLLGTITLIVLI